MTKPEPLKELKIIRIRVIMNNLSNNLNISKNNKEYQEWVMRNYLDRNIKFKEWVINTANKEIEKVLDEND